MKFGAAEAADQAVQAKDETDMFVMFCRRQANFLYVYKIQIRYQSFRTFQGRDTAEFISERFATETFLS